MKVTRIIFTPTGEERAPHKEEWFIGALGLPTYSCSDLEAPKTPRTILTRTEEEVEIPDPVPSWIWFALSEWNSGGYANETPDQREQRLAETIARHHREACR